MENLEQYIKENREAFDNGVLPEGHRMRFLKRIDKRKGQNVKYLYTALAAIAAVLIFAVIVYRPSSDDMEFSNRAESEYAVLVTSLENDILDLSKKCDKKVAKEAIKAFKNIIFEAIPLSEQLPEELSDIERARILRKYYKEKTDGLNRIKCYLAEQSIPEEEF